MTKNSATSPRKNHDQSGSERGDVSGEGAHPRQHEPQRAAGGVRGPGPHSATGGADREGAQRGKDLQLMSSIFYIFILKFKSIKVTVSWLFKWCLCARVSAVCPAVELCSWNLTPPGNQACILAPGVHSLYLKHPDELEFCS